MTLVSEAASLLLTIFIILEQVSGRLFTAECMKNPREQFLCATSVPDDQGNPPQGMTGHLGCSMMCTLDERCQYFNHRSSAAMPPCQLFYNKPTQFAIVDGCQHYHDKQTGALTIIASSPGAQKHWFHISSTKGLRPGIYDKCITSVIFYLVS